MVVGLSVSGIITAYERIGRTIAGYNHCYYLVSKKEKQIWAIVEKKINAKEKNRKRPSSVQRKNED